MRALALACNVLLFAFTCLVIVTDGAPTQAPYVAFTLLMLLVPVFTVVAIVRRGAGAAWTRVPAAGVPAGAAPADRPAAPGAALERAAAAVNLLLLACVVAAVAAQYPHPKEEGVVAFVVLALATPVVSAVALLRRRGR